MKKISIEEVNVGQKCWIVKWFMSIGFAEAEVIKVSTDFVRCAYFDKAAKEKVWLDFSLDDLAFDKAQIQDILAKKEKAIVRQLEKVRKLQSEYH